MASSLNKVMLIGNLGRDPEIRMTNDGKKIANLAIATSETWKDKITNEKREKTEWHRVVVFNEALVNVIENYVKKGSKVYLEGALQTRKWVDQSGQEKYTTEIVMQNYSSQLTLLDSKPSEGFAQGSYASANSQNSRENKINLVELDDEIPF